MIPANLGPIGALVAAAAYTGATPDVLRNLANEPPKPQPLTKGAWVICDGCAKGVHGKCHLPCHCDIQGCGEAA